MVKRAQDSLARDNPAELSHAAIARRAYRQKMIQRSCALSIAQALRAAGVDVEPFAWSHEQ